jgi:hypothetical protein
MIHGTARRLSDSQLCAQLINTLHLNLGIFAKVWESGALAILRKATISFVMSVCPSARKNSVPTGRIFMKFGIWIFFEDLP